MKIFVACNSPGYLRLRSSRFSFSEEQSYGIQRILSELDDVDHVEVNYFTCSILIRHHGDAKAYIDAVRTLSLDHLPQVPVHERDMKFKIAHDFKTSLLNAVEIRAITRYILPKPLAAIWTIYHAAKYVAKGLGALSKGKVNVDVLDGASVGFSMAFGHFDSAGSIMFLLGISDILQEYAEKRSRNALATSLVFDVDTVWVQKDGVEIQKPLAQVEIGEVVVIRSGAMIPIDGTVIDGEAGVNQASMTGESNAVLKVSGDSVFAGTVIEEGNLVVEVTALPSDSRIQSILNLLSDSEEAKAAITAKAEKLADRIVPYNFLFAALVLLITRNGHKALSALTVDYSCAIKLATPISVISAISEAGKRRIMVKGGKFLEAMAEADTIIFDKTGTLTLSEPVVKKILTLGEMNETEVLRISACLEEHFPHSLARAIVRYAEDQKVSHREEHTEVEYLVAHGIVSTWGDKRVVIGSHHFIIEDEAVCITDEQLALIESEGEGYSCIYLAIDKKLEGVICIQDPPRLEAKDVIDELRTLGIKHIVMLTGDSENTAKVISKQLGLDAYRSQVLPETKLDEVKKWQAEGHRVVMVGDGVNDSPALAQADVSVALRDSSDIAREVADIVLLSGDLRSLCEVRRLSLALMNRISTNFKSIVTVNTALLGLGATGLLPAETTALIHNLSTAMTSGLSSRPLLTTTK